MAMVLSYGLMVVHIMVNLKIIIFMEKEHTGNKLLIEMYIFIIKKKRWADGRVYTGEW